MCHWMVAYCNQIDAACTRMVVFHHRIDLLSHLVIVSRWFHIATRWVYNATGQIHLATGWLFYCSSQLVPFLMSFPVCRIDGVDKDGNVTTVTHSLSPDSVTLAQSYDAMKEDPDIYKTLDLCRYSGPRQFPEMQLPIPGALAPAQQSSTTSILGRFIPEHLITVMQCMHDEHVHFLQPLGRDPCAYFKEKDEERILRALGPDVVVCPFCSRRCRSHQRLVSHCKKALLQVTSP